MNEMEYRFWMLIMFINHNLVCLSTFLGPTFILREEDKAEDESSNEGEDWASTEHGKVISWVRKIQN